MFNPPAGSVRDTPELAQRYSRTSQWQRERGLRLVDLAAPQEGERVVDLGCGTGELSAELARRVGPTGRVIAIDPDAARLDHAKATVPGGLENLTFRLASAETLDFIEPGSIDLVYSNYAVHWVLEQAAMLDEAHRILRRGGRFVAEFLREPIVLLDELIQLMPNGDDIAAENCFLGEPAWRDLIAARNLEALRFDRPEIHLRYDGLESLFDWLEATSHGAFDADKVTPEIRRDLESRFPSEVSCLCKAFRMVLRRTQ